MGGITCNAEGFAGETGAVDVLEGGERDTNDLLSCSHYPLKGLAAGRVAGAIPHSDAASQDALDGASVEGAHDGGRGSGSSEFAEEVETLLCFLGQCRSVVSPGEVLCDVHTQELSAARSLHSLFLMKRLELCDGVQSWVSRVKRRGLSTHPWGAPVFSVMVLDVLMPTRTA